MATVLRTQAMELLAGVDGEIVRAAVEEQIARGEVEARLHAELTGAYAGYMPERSLWHVLHERYPLLAEELNRVPGAADGIAQVIVSLRQHAFRQQRAFANIGIRDARFGRPNTSEQRGYELRFTVTAEGEEVEHDPVARGMPLWEQIERKNAQLADVLVASPGAFEACLATLRAIKQMAIRCAWPVNQTGIRNGFFRPGPGGGTLRFEFYRSSPRG